MIMAGAEARALWQRTVNRCFVQEDAKRAPKLTYCQPPSSSSTPSAKQVEVSESFPSRAFIDPHNQSSMPLHCPNPDFPSRLWSHHLQGHNKPLENEVNSSNNVNEKKPESVELMETYDGCSEKKLDELAFDPSTPWSEKAGPWWRTTDKDELASLVAQRSLDYVENCDLPTPQNMKRSYYNGTSCGFRDYSVSNQTIHGPSSCKNSTDASSESDLSKRELLEALRHSQTRAREAENMAKEAYAEKEHLVKLLFKQASELFGYKQWLQLLQLEALYLKIKNKKIEEPQQPPVSIPWSDPKARKPGRKRRSKRGNNKPNNGAKYAVGLALGMSLVGAGLLLGWTVGWMQMLSF